MIAEGTLSDPSKVIQYRSPQMARDWTSKVGMIIFLGSWLMLFAALFLVYAGMRSRHANWPPLNLPKLPLGLPAVNTLVVIASSAAFHRGLHYIKGGETRRLFGALLTTTLLGTVFMVLQTVVWVDLHGAGLTPQAGGYASVFYGMTWVHAAHVVVGIGALGYLTVRARLGVYTAAKHLTVRLWSWYWHFVSIIWGLIFLSLYVL
jgi:cytochrome c oxidase subunit 3